MFSNLLLEEFCKSHQSAFSFDCLKLSYAKTTDNPHHNALTETANSDSLLHLPHHNNRGADDPVSTIPALFVRGRRTFLFYAAFPYNRNS